MKKVKKVTALVTAFAMTLSLAACGNFDSEDNTDSAQETTLEEESTSEDTTEDVSGFSAPITITFWTVFTGSDGDILREICAEYNETNTDNITVEIEIMDNDTFQSKLPDAISTGTGPDFLLVGIEYLREYVENGWIEDIADFWDVTGLDFNNFYDNVLTKSYVDGVQYGVPMQYNLQYLYYNKDSFEEAGLDPDKPPTTLDELGEYAVALTDVSKGKYGLGLGNNYGYYVDYLWANGGDVIDTNTDENLLMSEENIETLTWLQDLYNQGVSPMDVTAADIDDMFQSGQVAMCTAGPWNINGLNEAGVNYGICAVPGGSDGAYAGEGGCCYMLPAGTEETVKQAVYKFMAYWLSDDVLKKWSMENGFPVWSYSLLHNADIQNNEILASVSEASSIGRDWHLGYAYGSEIDNDVMFPMIQNIFAGGDVETELQNASNRLDEIISQ